MRFQFVSIFLILSVNADEVGEDFSTFLDEIYNEMKDYDSGLDIAAVIDRLTRGKYYVERNH